MLTFTHAAGKRRQLSLLGLGLKEVSFSFFGVNFSGQPHKIRWGEKLLTFFSELPQEKGEEAPDTKIHSNEKVKVSSKRYNNI